MIEIKENNQKPEIIISKKIKTLNLNLFQVYEEYKKTLVNKIEKACMQFGEDAKNIVIKIHIESITENTLKIEISSDFLGIFNCKKIFGPGNLAENATAFIFEKQLDIPHEKKSVSRKMKFLLQSQKLIVLLKTV